MVTNKIKFSEGVLEDIMKKFPIYKKPKWAVQQITRESGLIEDICKHGVGHPNRDWIKKYDSRGIKGFSIHGCDGCCSKETKIAIKKGKRK